MVTSALATLTPSHVDPADIRRATDEVLRGEAFRAAEPSLGQRAWTWALEGLFRLLDGVRGGDGAAIAGTAILVAAVVVTVVIALRLLLRVRRDRGVATPTVGFGGRSASDWEGLAREAEAAGRWDVALRCRYRALLAELIAAGITDEVAGRTARDYLRDVSAAAPDAERPLTWVTDAFEAAWYDRRPVSSSDLAAMRTASADVRRGALVGRR